jgi:hypothetical protein
VSQVTQEILGQWGQLDHKVLRVTQVYQVCRATQASPVLQETQVSQVTQEILESLVIQAPKALRVTQASHRRLL